MFTVDLVWERELCVFLHGVHTCVLKGVCACVCKHLQLEIRG